LHGSGSLYFAALGDSASSDVRDLASFLQKEFGIPVKILPPMSLPAEAYDAGRKQWVAEMLVQSMEAQYPDIAADPDARIVGVLEADGGSTREKATCGSIWVADQALACRVTTWGTATSQETVSR
jgi:predicted Zn-dependent protease